MVKWLFVLMAMGCSSKSDVEYDPTTGNTYVIECKHWTNACFYKAQERCRKGYTVKSSVETEKTGGVHGRYRAYVVTVRCN